METKPASRVHGTHYATGDRVEIHCDSGRITSVQPLDEENAPSDPVYVAPAFFDLQINGGGGHNFTSDQLTIDDVRAVVEICRSHGIGAFCPTLITHSFEVLRHGLSTIRRAAEMDAALADALPLIHLEGPYISPLDGPRGAHPREHVRAPNWGEFQRLQDAAGNRIGLLTLAPETDGAVAFIEKAVARGVVVALGHTAAGPDEIQAAIKAGARLSTHLGNGCSAMLPRHANPIWEQLAADELWASIICDGHHLPPSVVRSFVRAKTPPRIILTSDASSLAGLPPGTYHEWGHQLTITPAGKIVVADTPYLAGSWAFTDSCVGNVMRYASVSLQVAVEMATHQPRRLLGLPVLDITPEARADLVLFRLDAENQVRVCETIIQGQTVWRAA